MEKQLLSVLFLLLSSSSSSPPSSSLRKWLEIKRMCVSLQTCSSFFSSPPPQPPSSPPSPTPSPRKRKRKQTCSISWRVHLLTVTLTTALQPILQALANCDVWWQCVHCFAGLTETPTMAAWLNKVSDLMVVYDWERERERKKCVCVCVWLILKYSQSV